MSKAANKEYFRKDNKYHDDTKAIDAYSDALKAVDKKVSSDLLGSHGNRKMPISNYGNAGDFIGLVASSRIVQSDPTLSRLLEERNNY